MKRFVSFILVLLLIASVAACGGNGKPVKNKPSGIEQSEKKPTGSKEQSERTEQAKPSDIAAGKTNIICVKYNEYSDAKSKFDKYVLEQSHDHKVVSVRLGEAMVTELAVFDYLLPLQFMGESVKSFGKIDVTIENAMLQGIWAKDAELTYKEGTGYLLKGTGSEGGLLEIRVMYDADTDSLRLEGYKDNAPDFLFEYIKTPDGYAAQYHYNSIIGYDKFMPIEGLCTYRIIFDGINGSCARLDNTDSEPVSIFKNPPDAGNFIEGAAQWFTITKGAFTGNLGGEAF